MWRGYFIFALCALVFSFGGSPALAQPNPPVRTKLALLIGNQGYHALNILKIPHNDIDLVGGALRDKGFTVQVVKDADKAQTLEEVQKFTDNLRDAGHRVDLTDGGGIVGVPDVKGLTYADIPAEIPQVKKSLDNKYSGYPALLAALRKLLRDRCPTGAPVPLTIINAGYNTDPSNPATTIDDEQRLRDAYVDAWKEKNLSLIAKHDSFEKIAPPCR